MDKSSGRIVYL